MRSLWSLVGSPLICVLIAGCSDIGEGSALYVGDGAGTACVYGSDSGAATFGIWVVNQSDEPIELQSVETVGDSQDGLSIAGSAVLRVDYEDGIGAARNWPPDFGGDWELPDEWHDREEVLGAVLEPGDEVDIWVGLKADTGKGAIDALEIRYESESGSSYWQRTPDQLGVAEGSQAFCEGLGE